VKRLGVDEMRDKALGHRPLNADAIKRAVRCQKHPSGERLTQDHDNSVTVFCLPCGGVRIFKATGWGVEFG
jgi:hypothetical protein